MGEQPARVVTFRIWTALWISIAMAYGLAVLASGGFRDMEDV